MNKKMKELIALARKMGRDRVPFWGAVEMTEDMLPGQELTGHWSVSRSTMERALRRPLNDDEATLLSLSRRFGPTPSLPGNFVRQLYAVQVDYDYSPQNWTEFCAYLQCLADQAFGGKPLRKIKSIARRCDAMGHRETAAFVRDFAIAWPAGSDVSGNARDKACIAGRCLVRLAHNLGENDLLRAAKELVAHTRDDGGWGDLHEKMESLCQ